MLIHIWGKAAVAELDRVAGMYLHVIFIMGHADGSDVRAMEDAIEVVNRHDNVYMNLALSYAREGKCGVAGEANGLPQGAACFRFAAV